MSNLATTTQGPSAPNLAPYQQEAPQIEFEGGTNAPLRSATSSGLHIIGRSGLATSYPQAQGAGYTFDWSHDKGEIESEYELLVGRHQALVSKALDEVLDRKEELRLKMIEWEIDQLDKAKSATEVNLLARVLEQKKALVVEIRNLANEIKAQSR